MFLARQCVNAKFVNSGGVSGKKCHIGDKKTSPFAPELAINFLICIEMTRKVPQLRWHNICVYAICAQLMRRRQSPIIVSACSALPRQRRLSRQMAL
jgi:hypothetical protein